MESTRYGVFRRLAILLSLAAVVTGCQTSSPSRSDDTGQGDALFDTSDLGDAGGEFAGTADLTQRDADGESAGIADLTQRDVPSEWVFQRDAYSRVHGWILLDRNPQAVAETIQQALRYGVNHIQLSHDLIMNVEDVLGDDPDTADRISTLNQAIALAHENGMKTYVWTHEWSGVPPEICYDPEDPVWESRNQAYDRMFDLLPDLDGVILMFGSAPFPPWLTFCVCDWCQTNYPDAGPLLAPPPEARATMVLQSLGDHIVNRRGKELFVRTFVHQPAEVSWHSDGLAAVQGVEFTGMHKGPVQDWQPYNPHHPCMGNIGPHPSIMELDLAGEYYGLSVLPFCAPGYYRYRMRHLWKNRGIGVVSRVQRGSRHALGTANEVNVLAIRKLLEDIRTPLQTIWQEFLEERYGLQPGFGPSKLLQSILEDTFPIRLKSHYALGIWALEKGSDFPNSTQMDQFTDRGKMPKWDPEWQWLWDRLDRPDQQIVSWLWQEGSEAVELAADSLQRFEALEGELTAEDHGVLLRQLLHQMLAAEAFRSIDLVLWARKASTLDPGNLHLESWKNWGIRELERIRQAMLDAGLAGIGVASPEKLGQFIGSVSSDPSSLPPGNPPPDALFRPVRVVSTTPRSVTLEVSVRRRTSVFVDFSLTLPSYGDFLDLGEVEADSTVPVTIDGMTPGERYVVRLRGTDVDGTEIHGGEWWVFLDEE